MIPDVCEQIIINGHGVLSGTSFAFCKDAYVCVVFSSLDQEMGTFVDIFRKFHEVNYLFMLLHDTI